MTTRLQRHATFTLNMLVPDVQYLLAWIPSAHHAAVSPSYMCRLLQPADTTLPLLLTCSKAGMHSIANHRA